MRNECGHQCRRRWLSDQFLPSESLCHRNRIRVQSVSLRGIVELSRTAIRFPSAKLAWFAVRRELYLVTYTRHHDSEQLARAGELIYVAQHAVELWAGAV